jgi:hypothetical protein
MTSASKSPTSVTTGGRASESKVVEGGSFFLTPYEAACAARRSVGSLVYLSMASPGGCTVSAADPGICDMRVLAQNVAERTGLVGSQLKP